MNQPKKKPIVFCDFDGTITREDVWEGLIDKYDKRDWTTEVERWKKGELSSREWYEIQLNGLPLSAGELAEYIETHVKIDPDFAPFVAELSAMEIPLVVVSDGFDFYIERVLARNGLAHLPFMANHLAVVSAPVGAATITAEVLTIESVEWPGGALFPHFPHYRNECLRRNGNCKCAHIQQARTRYNNVVYIGDSFSDVCPLREADTVFARDRLKEYCQTNGIVHQPFETFADLRGINFWGEL